MTMTLIKVMMLASMPRFMPSRKNDAGSSERGTNVINIPIRVKDRTLISRGVGFGFWVSEEISR